MTSGMPDASCHSTRKRFIARIASGRSMSPRRQARSHGRGADIRAHRRDRVRLARQDVALLEPALGGEVEVAAAVRPDRARFLALDVALEPGGVDGLDEEFLGLLDGQAGVPFPGPGTGRGRRAEDRRAPTAANLPSGSSGLQKAVAGRPRRLRRSAHASTSAGRVDAGRARSYIARGGREVRRSAPEDADSVTASEFGFLALGLVLGVRQRRRPRRDPPCPSARSHARSA